MPLPKHHFAFPFSIEIGPGLLEPSKIQTRWHRENGRSATAHFTSERVFTHTRGVIKMREERDATMVTTELIAEAQAGYGDAFRELIEPHRRELQVHYYRMLGSFQ